MARKRKMSALQRKYFGKRRTRKPSRARVVYMARRRSYGRKRSYGRRSGGRMGLGGMMKYLSPVLGGVADAVINPRSPINGLGSGLVGFATKDEVTMKIGLYQVGQSVATFIPFIGAQAGGVATQV